MVERGAQDPVPAAQIPSAADRLISIREIRQMFGLGRTAAYELTHRPGFPAPVRISSRCYRWWEKEVAAFAAGLRDQAQADCDRGRRRATPQAPSARDASTPRITGKVRMARSRGSAR